MKHLSHRYPILSATCVLVIACSAAPLTAQSWLGNLVDRAARAGDRLDAQQAGNESNKQTPASTEHGSNAESQKLDSVMNSEPATGAAETPAPATTAPVNSDAAAKLEMVAGSRPQTDASDPVPSVTAPAGAPPASQTATPTVEPESNWAILRDLLAGEPPVAGGNGPILASLTPQTAAVANVVPVVAGTEESPSPNAAAASPARRSSSSSSQRATSQRSSTQRSRSSSQPRQQQQQQRQAEPRRGLYNPYSTYYR
jgi:hypothetical protein